MNLLVVYITAYITPDCAKIRAITCFVSRGKSNRNLALQSIEHKNRVFICKVKGIPCYYLIKIYYNLSNNVLELGLEPLCNSMRKASHNYQNRYFTRSDFTQVSAALVFSKSSTDSFKNKIHGPYRRYTVLDTFRY
jgi:hypothetical protein